MPHSIMFDGGFLVVVNDDDPKDVLEKIVHAYEHRERAITRIAADIGISELQVRWKFYGYLPGAGASIGSATEAATTHGVAGFVWVHMAKTMIAERQTESYYRQKFEMPKGR